ncbi:hypothetical protein ACFYWP_39785 [Actinacidiphila glaucinigra]|uniref:hypothetical protein n=1 Tax=Actinacidiphila glaucinigra TaxID=235986 RepID=UPI0036ACE630
MPTRFAIGFDGLSGHWAKMELRRFFGLKDSASTCVLHRREPDHASVEDAVRPVGIGSGHLRAASDSYNAGATTELAQNRASPAAAEPIPAAPYDAGTGERCPDRGRCGATGRPNGDPVFKLVAALSEHADLVNFRPVGEIGPARHADHPATVWLAKVVGASLNRLGDCKNAAQG